MDENRRPARRRKLLAWLVGATCLSAAVANPAAQIQSYTISVLLDVPGLQVSYPLEINDNGEVVGAARFNGDDRTWGWLQDGNSIVLARPLFKFAGHAAPTLSDFMLVPYLPNDAAVFQRTRVLHNGVVTPIQNPVLGNSETAVYGTDINESGVAVGFVLDLDDGAGLLAFIWKDGATSVLEQGDAEWSWAGAINDDGMVAGGVLRPGDSEFKPVIWRDGLQIALSPLDGVAHHVNNAGVVLGQLRSAADRAFLWHEGALIDPCPSLAQCTGMHLNEAGQTLIRAGLRSYVFEDGTLTDLGTLGPGVGTFAHTLIDNGAVVGFSSPDGSYTNARAFLYSDGALKDLNGLLPPGSGWTRLIDAIGVNSLGQIVGIGIKDGIVKAFVMTPVP